MLTVIRARWRPRCRCPRGAASLRPADRESRFSLPQAAIEISDQLTLKLPVGDIQIRTGDFEVGVDSKGNVNRFRGSADTVLPSLMLPNNLHWRCVRRRVWLQCRCGAGQRQPAARR